MLKKWIFLSRRIYRGAVNLLLFRHCPYKIFWKYFIWKLNIRYKNDWNTIQKLTKPVFAFRHWENVVSSSTYPSWFLYWISKYYKSLNIWILQHLFFAFRHWENVVSSFTYPSWFLYWISKYYKSLNIWILQH